MNAELLTPREAARVARLPLRGLTERDTIIRITLMIDAAQRELDELCTLGSITEETQFRANSALSSVAADLANIPRR